jgi:hypothetical protein
MTITPMGLSSADPYRFQILVNLGDSGINRHGSEDGTGTSGASCNSTGAGYPSANPLVHTSVRLKLAVAGIIPTRA